MVNYNLATVVSFDGSKKVGVVEVAGLGIFEISFNDGEFFIPGRDHPVFSGKHFDADSAVVEPLLPEPGDNLMIQFERLLGENVVFKWGHTSDYDEANEAIN